MSIPQANRTDEELNRLFTEAFNAQTEEHFTEAEEKYLLLLDYFPQAAMLHYNLGLVYLYGYLANTTKDKRIRKTYVQGLDLGCGTGLGGIVFEKMVAILHGVDLSANMLLELLHCSLPGQHQPLSSADHHRNLRFFFAADVFIYAGALEEFVAMACPRRSSVLS